MNSLEEYRVILLSLLCLLCQHQPATRMGGASLSCWQFYRFPERAIGQSACSVELYRTKGGRTGDLAAANGRWPLLRPAWQVSAPARRWSAGAGRPALINSAPRERRGERGGHPASAQSARSRARRGCRAGWRHQLRRDGAWRTRAVDGSPTADAKRWLSCPQRLSEKHTVNACTIPENSSVNLNNARQCDEGNLSYATSCLRVGHLNVRSVTKHLDDINHLLVSERLDVLCLSETWLSENMDSSTLVFPGYTVVRRDRSGRSGGGVAIIHSSSLIAERLNVPSAGSSLESLWLQLTSRRQLVIGVIYRPPGEPPVLAIDDLHDQLVYVMTKGKPMLVLGDTNFDILRPDKSGVSSYMQLLSSLSLHQLITTATRPGSSPTLLDHIITNHPELTSGARVTPCSISDHDLVTASVTGMKTKQRPTTITVRSTRHLSQDALCLDLLLADWSALYRATSTDEKWSAWRAVWEPILDRHMPTRQVKLRHKPQPWLYDDAVREAKEARERARADRERTPCVETEREYRLCRNAVKIAQRGACSRYFLSSYSQPKSTTWRDIRRFLVMSKKPAPRLRNPAAARSAGWFNRLNQHFTTVGSAVADSLAAADTGEKLSPRPPRVCSGAFSPRPATLPELSAALQRMGRSKTCGGDGITIDMLRMTFSVVGPHILNVVNSSIVRCELPPAWQTAEVIPVHKGGDMHEPSNYRPISILSVVSKLCERVVCAQLTDYLVSHNILCSQQYGFRPGLSTEAALLDTVTYAVNNIDNGRVTSLVTADTSKAFDSIEHGRLLEKLGWYGVDERWFRAWLSGRCQAVRGGTGETLPVTHGVIQGSILGPILFLLFTNDLPQHVPHGKLVMYADDVQFLDTELANNLPQLKCRIEETLSVALQWFTKNRLKINPIKTDMVLLKSSRRSMNCDFAVKFGKSNISCVRSTKILGVTFDWCLTWEQHVTTIVRKCYSILIGLARMQLRIPRDTKRLLIEALVFPHLHYCMSVWGSCTATQKRRLQKCVNFGARIVTGLGYREHVSETLRDLGWSRIEQMVTKRDACAMYRLTHDAETSEVLRSQTIRRSDVAVRETRNTADGQLELPHTRTEFARRSFLARAVRAWNKLPSDVKGSPTLATFKKKLAGI